MYTLPNVNPDEAGKTPLTLDLPPTSPLKVQSSWQRTPTQGDTSDFVRKENHHWFVFRALYGHTNDAVDVLKAKDIQVYIPMHYDKIEISGKKRLRKVPFLPGLVFAYMTREMTHLFVKQPAPTAKYLKYYTDKTSPIESKTGLNPPVIVSDAIMDNFIKASRIDNNHCMMLPKERCRFKKDELVKIIKGDFKGIVGKVTRAAGQQRIGIDIESVGVFVTAYIPSDFIETLNVDK